jgi:Tfp pilus assembly protein FimV
VLAGLCAALLAGCATVPPISQEPPPGLAPAEIVAAARAGEPAAALIERMRAARVVYRLAASELARMREQGVPDEVIDHMQQTWLDAERTPPVAALPVAVWIGFHSFYRGPWPPPGHPGARRFGFGFGTGFPHRGGFSIGIQIRR